MQRRCSSAIIQEAIRRFPLMSDVSREAALGETIRAGIVAGFRLVPGTISRKEHQAWLALDALLALVEQQEKALQAARDMRAWFHSDNSGSVSQRDVAALNFDDALAALSGGSDE